VDPALDHAAATVFWMPQDDTSIVVLAEAPPELDVESGGDHLPAVIPGSDGEAMVWLANGEHIQIQLLASASNPAVAVIPLNLDGFGRLEAVHRLLAALHGRAIPPDTRLTRQQRTRARRMLQAFDGSRDGATQQDIARALFRLDPVSRDEWQASSSRHAVMGLLRDARAMIAGGYRNLLRHRRRA